MPAGKGLEIFAFVIMSNHIHILARSSSGELSNTVRDFKKFTSKRIIESITEGSHESRRDWILRLFSHAAKRQNKEGEFQVWTHENHAIEVTSNSFIESKVDYIHNNPVRAGIVKCAEDYLYSSASVYSGDEGMVEIIPVTFRIKTIK